jgi:hypothetical protein
MLGILIDAAVMMVLLKTISGEDVGFGTAILLGLGTSIVTFLLALGLGLVLGIVAGIVVAGVIGAAGLGVVVSALFGVEIKRSFLIGALFMVVHIGVGVAFELMFRT